MRALQPGEALSIAAPHFPHPSALRAATFSPEGRRKRRQAFPRPQAQPAGVVANEGQRSAARRWFGIRFRELRTRRGWIEPPSARPVALRQATIFKNSGPRFCHAGVSRCGLASSSRRDRSVPRSVPEASRERGATLARRRRTHPAKRHASGRPPLGDGMRGTIREVRRAGIHAAT
jgi:hypothetical protein